MLNSIRRSLVSLTALLAVAACGGADAPVPANEEEEPAPLTGLTEEEQQTLAYLQAPEMQDGRLDTVDMMATTDDAGWHVRIVNYRTDVTAMLYTAWYSGADTVVQFAADGQPILIDEDGRTYAGMVTPINPRIQVTKGYAAVGVMVFQPRVAAEADSLTLYVNQETPPVLRVGPFGVVHDHTLNPSSVDLIVE